MVVVIFSPLVRGGDPLSETASADVVLVMALIILAFHLSDLRVLIG